MTDSKPPPVIALENLRKSFGIGDAEHAALDGITLTVKRGEFIAIMGPSGCGKTTLLNVLGLLDGHIEGDYKLDGKSIGTLSRRKQARIRSEQIGFVFQSFNLISRLNIIDNVALPLIYRGMTKLARTKKASKILSDFHLGEREYYMPNQLSGGQMQRVAIARALVNEPSIILADEPTGNLDSHASHIIMEELSDLHQKGNTIIMVTHNPNLTTYASRVITMLDGKIDTDTFRLPSTDSVTEKRPLNEVLRVDHKEPTRVAVEHGTVKQAAVEEPTPEQPKKITLDDIVSSMSSKTATTPAAGRHVVKKSKKSLRKSKRIEKKKKNSKKVSS